MWGILKAIFACMLIQMASLIMDHPLYICPQPITQSPSTPPPSSTIYNIQEAPQASSCACTAQTNLPLAQPPPSPEPSEEYITEQQPSDDPDNCQSHTPINLSCSLMPPPISTCMCDENMPDDHVDLRESCPAPTPSVQEESSRSKSELLLLQVCYISINIISNTYEDVLDVLLRVMKDGNMHSGGWNDAVAIKCLCEELKSGLLVQLLFECEDGTTPDYDHPT